MAKTALKMSAIVREKFITFLAQVPEKALKCPPWLNNALILACLNLINGTEIVHHVWRKNYILLVRKPEKALKCPRWLKKPSVLFCLNWLK